MKRIGVWAVGALTLLPLCYLGIAAFEVFAILVEGRPVRPWLRPEAPIHLAAIAVILFVVILTFRHLRRDATLPRQQKALWIAALLLGGPFAYPVYWWFRGRASIENEAGHSP